MRERGGAGLNRCESGVRERKERGAGWMGEWEEGERMSEGWMDAEVG